MPSGWKAAGEEGEERGDAARGSAPETCDETRCELFSDAPTAPCRGRSRRGLASASISQRDTRRLPRPMKLRFTATGRDLSGVSQQKRVPTLRSPERRWSLLRRRHHEPRVRAPSASLMCLFLMTHPLGRLRDAEEAYREASGSRASSPAALGGGSELAAGVEGVAGKPRRTPPAWDARTPEPKRLRRSRWDADTFSARVSPPSTRGARDARVATRRLDETPAPKRAADAASGNPETDASPTKTSGDARANLGVAEVAERAAAELRDRARVRVFHLPRALTERDVREMFTPFGALEEVRLLPSDSVTEIDEGTRECGVSASASVSAVVAFASADAASAALRLDGLLIGDRHLRVSRPASARARDPPERAPDPPRRPKKVRLQTEPRRRRVVQVQVRVRVQVRRRLRLHPSRRRLRRRRQRIARARNYHERHHRRERPGPPPRPLAAENPNPARVYVGNVAFSTSERELEALFATFGPLVSCHLVLSTSGSAGDGTRAANAAARAAAARGGVGHRGYGFVEYACARRRRRGDGGDVRFRTRRSSASRRSRETARGSGQNRRREGQPRGERGGDSDEQRGERPGGRRWRWLVARARRRRRGRSSAGVDPRCPRWRRVSETPLARVDPSPSRPDEAEIGSKDRGLIGSTSGCIGESIGY